MCEGIIIVTIIFKGGGITNSSSHIFRSNSTVVLVDASEQLHFKVPSELVKPLAGAAKRVTNDM